MIPKIKSLLYATDLSENSAYAFRYAINSAQKHDARIHIVHALERPLREYLNLIFPNLDREQLVKMWEEKKPSRSGRSRNVCGSLPGGSSKATRRA